MKAKLLVWREPLERWVARLIPSNIHPNHMTSFRIVVILILVASLYYQFSIKTIFFLVLAAGLSDTLDGITARQRHQITPLGTALDPVADKLFVLVCLLILNQRGLVKPAVFFWILALEGHLVIIPVLSFIYRVLFGRPVKRQFAIRPNIFGKGKMIALVAGFALVFLGQAYGWPGVGKAGRAMVYLGLALSAMALVNYILDWIYEKY